MAAERRNLYRILYVQPEAPQEVIKAAYRALMSTLRAHPDLGGEHDLAARINAAYAILGDPEQRRAYDRGLRRPVRGAPPPAPEPQPAHDPTAWLDERRCPFCARAFSALPAADTRCARCDSPLAQAPAPERLGGELIGRRHGERFERDTVARVRLPGGAGERTLRLRDLSLTGLSLLSEQRLPRGAALRVCTAHFDAVAVIVACRAADPFFTVHARLLTLQILKQRTGVYVDAKA